MGICCARDSPPYMEQKDGVHQTARVASITDDQDKYNSEIEQNLQREKKSDKLLRKLLLLGSGSSGKSTFFKQLKQIYQDVGLVPAQWEECKFLIRSNCITSIVMLLQKSQFLYDLDKELYKDCYIDLDDSKEVVGHIQRVLDNQSAEDLAPQTAAILAESISFLWKLPQVKATYENRHHFSFIENMDYFFAKNDQIFDMKYEPTMEDVLRSRARTTGLIEEKFKINDVWFSIFDAGGQRTERRKWIELFEGVTAIIFVAALNHYCTVLFEDERKNAMHESLELFHEIVNAKWFRKTAVVLFLNKNDIFEQRLKEGLTLDIAFGEGWKGRLKKGITLDMKFGEDWKGPNYQDERGVDENGTPYSDAGWLKKCSEEGAKFIGKKYRDMNTKYPQKKIFQHVTTATDRNNVEKVFWDVQNIIISKNLTGAGLV